VPWSNIIQTTPNQHLLFRGPGNADELQLQSIAEVDPVLTGLKYDDRGQHNNTPLGKEKYCYRVMTRGAYGNPKIREPLENYSQIICTSLNADEPPCAPQLSVTQTNCEEFLATQACNVSSFHNTLRWVRPEGECGENIQGYKVYRAASKDGEFTWLKNAGVNGIVADTSFIDAGEDNTGLSSMAFCYRITAVNNAGAESEMSEASCNDNCPYYELPNMFSPSDGNPCNDRFSAWRTPENYIKSVDENGSITWKCGEVDAKKCVRFILGVKLRVYNRWGKEVYSYRSTGERTIYIDWDGRDDKGRELAAGVYYYVAELEADTVDPSKKTQFRKGWVHLIR
jgi:hypothetical protein